MDELYICVVYVAFVHSIHFNFSLIDKFFMYPVAQFHHNVAIYADTRSLSSNYYSNESFPSN